MKLKHKELQIDSVNPFENCKLDRRKYAMVLTNIVGKYSDGFVLALNNEWGTGKTTFVKMWQQELNLEGYPNLYFNAWENDYEANPLVALMAELKELITPENREKAEKKYKALLAKGAVITKSVLPHLMKALAIRYFGHEAVGELIGDTAQGSTEIFEQEVKEYNNKKEGLKEFKQRLSDFVKEAKEEKPIVFIIDELDRCRPNYAVELLEQIKHFFSIEGIVFVLSIDKLQLGHAVRGVYGNDRINADEYLRRFIDIEYSLPIPDPKLFCTYLYDYFELNDFFTGDRQYKYGFHNERENVIEITTILFKISNATLRQQEKVFAHARLGLIGFREDHYVFPELYLILVFIRTFHCEYYLRIRLKQLNYEELLSGFKQCMPKEIDDYNVRFFIKMEALLLYLYYASRKDHSNKQLIEKTKEANKDKVIVKSCFEKSEDDPIFIEFVKDFLRNYSPLTIDHILNRIDLIEQVIE